MLSQNFQFGPTQKLCMGMEAGFYVDDVSVQKPHELYAFNPCGHITTEKTARFVFNVIKYVLSPVKI